ncbi:MAG: TolC family outer membrane protein [Methylacidiphilales bacterium]|nr:TolC family outer membrane protein [Candidatus Methylacidiphilales bacterium]
MPTATGIRAAALGVVALALVGEVQAQTLESALAQAYRTNPTLNSQRAGVRAVDENVPQALSGYRPRITGTADIGDQSLTTKTWTSTTPPRGTVTNRDNLNPSGYGLTLSQTVYNGGQTTNRVRQAEAQVIQARETLRNSEQNVLLDGVTAYMNVLRDTAIVTLRQQNVAALEEQLRATRDRFQVGEVTRTDVAQAEARLAGAQSLLLSANARLQTSRAQYREVIGSEPGRLVPGRPIDKLLPASLEAAVASGLSRHPAIEAAKHGADAAMLEVKVAEGSLLPIVTLEASYLRRFDGSSTLEDSMTAQVVGRLTVPIYQGGSEYATIRQAKETLGQKRLDVDVSRDQVRAAIVQSWGELQAAKAQIEAEQTQVRANEIALEGVREEARVGQRTTLDVLNAQTELVNSQVALVVAQRDRVVASYSVLSGIGRLSAKQLGLKVEQYDEAIHYNQVRDAWIGVRTPDGK